MTLADPQQLRLLGNLRQAGDRPVAFAELRAGGVDFPAALVAELELNGYAIERSSVYRTTGGSSACVCSFHNSRTPPPRPGGAGRADSPLHSTIERSLRIAQAASATVTRADQIPQRDAERDGRPEAAAGSLLEVGLAGAESLGGCAVVAGEAFSACGGGSAADDVATLGDDDDGGMAALGAPRSVGSRLSVSG